MITPEMIDFLTGKSAYSFELQCLFMAMQGCRKVRQGKDCDRSMALFHAFCLSVVVGFGGGLFTPFWVGLPTPMISGDIGMAACIIAFAIYYFIPFDIGYRICSTFPVVLVETVFAQLFRILGICNFVDRAFFMFGENASPYYPIPVIGPILYASLLGNMGPFFVNGFHGHLKNGMPFNFQNGIVCASFYHFFTNDSTGIVGVMLRHYVDMIPGIRMGIEDDKTFARVVVAIFMQVTAILQLPSFLGPTFNPFTVLIPDLSTKTKKAVVVAKKSIEAPSKNGVSKNGVSKNVMSKIGMSKNGMSKNGTSKNGVSTKAPKPSQGSPRNGGKNKKKSKTN